MTNRTSQEFQILIDSTHTLAELDVRYRDRTSESILDEHALELAWQAHRVDHPEAVNQPLLRLDSYGNTPAGIELRLSNTEYREYIATRSPALFEQYGQWGLANPLTVCIVAVTSDDFLMIERRPEGTSHAGRLHIIGGFMEGELDSPHGLPDPCFAIQRECQEEIGAQVLFDSLRVLGLAYDRLLPHPELLFGGRLERSLAEIQEHMPQDRHGEFEVLHPVRATPDELANFLREHDGEIVPTGHAALLLWGQANFGEGWSQELGFRSF